MQPKYSIDGAVHDVTPLHRADDTTLEIDGHQLDVRLQWIDSHRGEIAVNGKRSPFFFAQDGNTLFVHFDGRVWTLSGHDEFGDATESGAGGGRVSAPMPGVVVELFVSEGSSVTAGTMVMLIESMKLQTEIKAPVTGIVSTVGVEAGSSFEKGAMLVDIESGALPDFDAGATGLENTHA